jgi:hypothetical protein
MSGVKIGILTFHFANNFGAVLQAFALSKFLELNKYSNEIIDFRPYNLNYENMILPISHSSFREIGLYRTFRRLLYFLIFKLRRKRIMRIIKFSKFRKDTLRLSRKRYNSPDSLKNLEYKFIIIGSDQVYNLELIEGYESAYFQFDNITQSIISYAASLGKDLLNQDYVSRIKKFTSNHLKMSIRESESARQLKIEIEKDIQFHLDPVFLLDDEDYFKLDYIDSIEFDYIFVYDLESSDHLSDFVDTVNKDKIPIVSYREKSKYENKYNNIESKGPYEFLSIIRNAKLVISTSFHGVAFSILFKKEFIAYLPNSNYMRIVEMLKYFNLEDRIYDRSLPSKEFSHKMNYDGVDTKINENKEASLQYFKLFSNL